MAIYSLNHKSIGKSTQQRPYTAGAHVNYITRTKALGRLDGARLPVSKDGARAFFNRAEDSSRANGRIADKIMLALPRELTPAQRYELVRSFAEDVTGGRGAWLAAHHDKGKDAANPHCHLIIRDQDPATGKRVFGMSERGSTQRLREMWQAHANRALERAGRSERIDARTLKAQGLERRPTIHVGVRARQLVGRHARMRSRPRMIRNSCQARSRERMVDYPAIDGGQLRLARNVEIRRSNMFASRAEHREREYWAAIDEDAFRRDIRELKRLNAVLQFGDDGRTPMRWRDEALSKGRDGPEF